MNKNVSFNRFKEDEYNSSAHDFLKFIFIQSQVRSYNLALYGVLFKIKVLRNTTDFKDCAFNTKSGQNAKTALTTASVSSIDNYAINRRIKARVFEAAMDISKEAIKKASKEIFRQHRLFNVFKLHFLHQNVFPIKKELDVEKKLSLILYNPWNKLDDLYTLITKCQARAILFIYFNYLETNLR